MLRLMISEGQCVATFGRTVLYPCDEVDTGLRMAVGVCTATFSAEPRRWQALERH